MMEIIIYFLVLLLIMPGYLILKFCDFYGLIGLSVFVIFNGVYYYSLSCLIICGLSKLKNRLGHFSSLYI